MRTYEDIVKDLDSPIPRDVIAQREGGGRSKLSYLEGWYVIDRMNKVFGPGNWQYRLGSGLDGDAGLKCVHSAKEGDKFSVHYIANVTVDVRFSRTAEKDSWSDWTQISDVGYGDGSDKYNIGKAHELAVKEAVTDALKRCCKSLGMSMGLALYDKAQENVSDGPAEAPAVKPGPGKANPGGAKKAEPGSVPAASAPSDVSEATREALNKKISSTSAVVVAKKKADKTTLQEYMLAQYKAKRKEDLTDAQATDLLAYLEKLVQGDANANHA